MRPRSDPLLSGLIVLVVVAVLAAGWFGFRWLSAANDTELSYGRERDTVLQAAGSALTTLHTVDHRTAERDVDRWIGVTAGGLHDDLDGDRDGQLKRARSSRTVSTAKLVRAAVVDLDAHAGTARVIAVLDVRLSAKNAKPSTERRRMNAELLRSADRWKIAAVEAAA